MEGKKGYKEESKGDAKVVKFEKKITRNEFRHRGEYIWKQGQFTVDEGLTDEERARRKKLVEKGRKLRSDGTQCYIGNRFLKIEVENKALYLAFHPTAGYY